MDGNVMSKLKNQGRKLSSDDMNFLERLVKKNLPDSYKRFLIENNGGDFSSMHIINVDGLEGGTSDVRLFLGVDDPIESCNISWNLTLLRESLPQRNLLPIASDSGGGLFCLNFDEQDQIGVVFVNSPFDEDFGIYSVSRSFDDFMNGVFKYSD